MSNWNQRRTSIAAESDYDPLTSIPMLEAGYIDEAKARQRLTHAFDIKNCKDITIIDPYLLERDIGTILELFSTQSERNITVITFLNRVKNGEDKSPDKVTTATTIKNIVDDLTQKGIFASFEVVVTDFEFHDRFFFCTDEDKDGLLVSSGGSLSMFLTKYSSLIRITNRTFRRTLLQFIDRAKQNGKNLTDYIEEWSR
ncbi:hypothetical protein [Vogesella oryzae]|uniref:hypothetical protein n=1 Tax=Vogesella oryzae TaxID=1735285 RepID=UPI001584125C|nr:hypothetical protein [Vogesella oryzae]